MSTAPRMAPLGPSGHAFIILSHSPTGSGLPQEECDLEQGDFAAEAALVLPAPGCLLTMSCGSVASPPLKWAPGWYTTESVAWCCPQNPSPWHCNITKQSQVPPDAYFLRACSHFKGQNDTSKSKQNPESVILKNWT